MRSSSWHRHYRPEKTNAEIDDQARAYFAHLWRTKGYAVIPVEDLTDWAEENMVETIATRLYGVREGS